MNQATNTWIEPGCIEEVGGILHRLNAESVFLVADRQAYAASGAQAALVPFLADRDVVVFDAFAPNPKYQDVTRGVELFRAQPCDAIIAVGGGSALDMGKLIGFCAVQPEAPVVVVTNQAPIRYRPRPLIAIPTTAGTGSEATHFAVVYVDGNKHSVAHEWILPAFAIIDPELTANLPPQITAHTGLDALCQAVESMWSVHSTGQSLAYAREALGLVRDHLVKAVNAPTPGVRWAMCRAAHLSGKAINIGKTTAPHAVSYALTSHFGVPHGLAVALSLGTIAVFNDGVTGDDVCDVRGAGFVRARIREICDVLRVPDAAGFQTWMEHLLRQTGCPTRLREIAVANNDIPTLASEVNLERLANNPRQLTQEALCEILTGIV